MPGTTPVYGFPYPEPTDLVADYPALGQQLAEDIEDVLPTIVGLAPATPTSIANSGGSASLTDNTVTFSGVTSVSLNGCFTATFTHYRAVMRLNAPSSANTVADLRMRASGTDATAGNYQYGIAYIARTTGAASSTTGNNATSMRVLGGYNAETVSDVFFGTPQLAVATTISLQGVFANNTDIFSMEGAGIHQVATAYDGLTLFVSSGSSISGTISIFGYRK